MPTRFDVRTGRHRIFALHARLVFVTKYRHRRFSARHLARLETIFGDALDDFGAGLVGCNGETDHVHLLINYPPTVAISNLVNSLKGVSSRMLRKEFPELARHYWRAQRLWSGSYFTGSLGGPPPPSCTNTSNSKCVRPDGPNGASPPP